MKRSTVCIALLGLLLVGCTGGGTVTVTVQATPTATEAPTTSNTPTPLPSAPVLLTKTEAAARYTKIVKASNDLITAFDKLTTARTFKKQRSLAGQIAASDRTLGEQLLGVAWPTSVASLTQQLSTEVAGEIICYVDLSHAKTWTNFVSVYNSRECTSSDPSAKVAESIRIRLGLPNVPV